MCRPSQVRHKWSLFESENAKTYIAHYFPVHVLPIPNIERASSLISMIFAPPSWGLARQEHARSPTNGNCKRNIMSDFSRRKSVERDRGGSKRDQGVAPFASTAALFNLLETQSCIDLSVDAEPDEYTAIAQIITQSSDVDSEYSDRESTIHVASDSEPETDQSAISSSTGTAPEHGQLTRLRPIPRAPISAMFEGSTHKLPPPTEDPLYVFRRTTILNMIIMANSTQDKQRCNQHLKPTARKKECRLRPRSHQSHTLGEEFVTTIYRGHSYNPQRLLAPRNIQYLID